MATVVKQDTGNLEAELTITLSQDDYRPRFESELAKYRKKAHIKGFRKGKTPAGFIKKMYGKGVLAEVVEDLFQRELYSYITEQKLDVLGQPIPADDQAAFDFDPSSKEDFEMKVEIGLAPEFDVAGIGLDESYERYEAQVAEESIDDDLMNARKRLGTRELVESTIEEDDLVKLNAEELDGGNVKENGWATEISLLVSQIADEDLKAEMLTKKKGDTIRLDVRKLEKNVEDEYIRKHILKVQENDQEVEIGFLFEGLIHEVSRIQPAEFNEEFFTKCFGKGEVKDEAEAREFIRKDIKKYYDRQADSLLFRDFQDRLIERNSIELPDRFLKKWLKTGNKEATDELIEKEYDTFTRGLRWSLIRGKLIKKYGLEVSENEIVEGFKDRVRGYFGGYGDELVILNMANRLMEDNKQVDNMYQELMTDKLFEAIKEDSAIAEKEISTADFDELIKEARAKLETEQAPEEEMPDNITSETPEEEVAEDIEQ